MPSLLSTTVAANYGRMIPQQTYGVGEGQTNFGTRQLVLVKVLRSAGTNSSFILVDGSTADVGGVLGWTLKNSIYSAAVRTLQQFGEIYAVYTPVATGFMILMALDTLNSSESANGVGGQIATTYGLAEAQIKAAVEAINAQSDVGITISVPSVTIGTTL
jgi:hypothetical protein